MRRLFLSTYAGLALVLVAALAIAGAWDLSRRRGPGEWIADAADAPKRVREAFAEEPDQEHALARLHGELDAFVTIAPPDGVPPPFRARLERGQPAFPPPGGPPDLWIPVGDGRIVRLRPDHRPAPVPLIAAAVLLGLGLVVAWQLRPLDRQLRALSDAATRFGEGQLSVRVRLPPNTPVGELGSRFDAMAERIARLVSARQELLQAVSHELRTPLQRVRFGVELLADAPGPERERLLEGVHRDLDGLDALVGELLDWGRLDADAGAWQEVDLEAIVRALGAEAQVPVRSAPARVRADAGLIRRAIGNLLSNAQRFRRSRIELSSEVHGGEVTVAVDDDGPGIAAEDRERVLEPFVRLGEARSPGGVGLGLALVDRIARSHGGRLVVEDSALGGARVVLVLPLTNADVG